MKELIKSGVLRLVPVKGEAISNCSYWKDEEHYFINDIDSPFELMLQYTGVRMIVLYQQNTYWKLGDLVFHEKYGIGVLSKKVEGSVFEVDFEEISTVPCQLDNLQKIFLESSKIPESLFTIVCNYGLKDGDFVDVEMLELQESSKRNPSNIYSGDVAAIGGGIYVPTLNGEGKAIITFQEKSKPSLLEQLMQLCKCSVSIDINDHKNYYQTAEQSLNELDEIERSEISKEVFDEMVKRNMIVYIHVYPKTPIGFYSTYHWDLNTALKEMIEVVKKNIETE